MYVTRRIAVSLSQWQVVVSWRIASTVDCGSARLSSLCRLDDLQNAFCSPAPQDPEFHVTHLLIIHEKLLNLLQQCRIQIGEGKFIPSGRTFDNFIRLVSELYAYLFLEPRGVSTTIGRTRRSLFSVSDCFVFCFAITRLHFSALDAPRTSTRTFEIRKHRLVIETNRKILYVVIDSQIQKRPDC